MSCPEKQILSVIESATEAIARSAREESALTQDDLLEAAQAGVTRAFAEEEKPRIKGPVFASEFEEGILHALGELAKYTAVNVEMGKLFNDLSSPLVDMETFIRNFNECIHNLELAGLIITTRIPNTEPLVRLSGPGIEAASEIKELDALG